MGRNKKTYTLEFKRKCIEELMNGKEFGKVAADNNIAPSTLSGWKKEALANFGSKELKKEQKKASDAEEKLKAAIEIIGKKEMEIELLKKEQHF